MPIYEYKCKDCGKITEILFKSRDEKVELNCRHCGSKNLVKQISTPGAIRMGNGQSSGATCCGRGEPCDTPPCSADGSCHRI
ncbi:MAG TPA: zinc ribbon domain-containing protein [candidate division WOR-3 bacterium]|uniref:Zinc ribbon domain-containing protein n=1 Tax=candidate division WOR-3 bacterium TaxID=2052148 RepID=A0A9C9EP84_UNCW3|nr:zinc ribbon domain-containing protein [candidate division WOR-3 bacterium]